MGNRIVLAGFLFLSVALNGCLVGHKIVYEIKPDKMGKGTATVWYTDIRSDATNDQQFEEDKNNLFDYMLKSSQFISDRKKEGKNVIARELYLEDNKLNGKVTYKFNKLSDVEKALSFEDGFYFLTLALDDSVLTTNGEIIKSANYKRILWGNDVNTLKFEISIEPAEGTPLKELAPLYKP
ncbi:MAG: hypothetical protein ACM3S2_19560 [Ignavibacteriales bacterium]